MTTPKNNVTNVVVDDDLEAMKKEQQADGESGPGYCNRHNKNMILSICVAVGLLVIAIALAISFDSSSVETLTPPNTNTATDAVAAAGATTGIDDATAEESSVDEAEGTPTVVVPPSPTSSPSFSPTGLLDELLLSLSESTRLNIKIPTTPQRQAWQWLQGHPQLSTLELWRQRQLFAVSTFYFGLGGLLEEEHEEDGATTTASTKTWPTQTTNQWLDYSVSECRWGSSRLSTQFIRCTPEDDKIQSIYVHNLDLSSFSTTDVHIPPEIALLTQLSILSLGNNQISNITLDQFLPQELYQMDQLKVLALDRNAFVGTIPWKITTTDTTTGLGYMKGLQELYLWENPYLTGQIFPSAEESQSFTGLTNLIKLDLSHCDLLEGTIPAKELVEISPQLQFLRLHENPSLAGTIPSQLGLLTKLTDLYLRKNTALTGTLPTQLGRLTNLIKLNIGKCSGLSGTIPTQLGLLSNLGDRSIWLEGNSLEGTIPTQIGYWTDLGLLLLNKNQLQGNIPSQIGLMEGVEEISLYDNSLTGLIPSQLGLLTSTAMQLTRLYLYNNDLSGTIPNQLAALWQNGTIQGLRLQNNPKLTGTIPPVLCDMGEVTNPDDWWQKGLLFDCRSGDYNNNLCGCTWCPCKNQQE